MLLAVGEAGKPCESGMPRRFSVYQFGRGSAPVVVVRSALPFVVVNTPGSPNFINRKRAASRRVVELD